MDKVTSAVWSIPDAPGDGGWAQGYTVSQAAQLLGVSRATVWRWVQAGKLPVSRLGKRTTRIHRKDLERFLPPGASAGPWSVLPHQLMAGTALEHYTMPSLSDSERGSASEHFVQFYESDVYLQNAVGEYVGAALTAGDAAVVVATEEHRLGIE